MNYTNGILTPSYINKKKFEVEENNDLSENVISLPAVHTHQFEVKVLNSAQVSAELFKYLLLVAYTRICVTFAFQNRFIPLLY